jgi:hypothetical protein
MAAGDTIPVLLQLEQDDGTAATYADKTAFQAAGWDIDWLDTDGDALASTPTWAIESLGSGLHLVTFTLPTGFYVAQLTIPSGFVSNSYGWTGEGITYDNDALAGLLLTANGQAVGETRTTGTLEDLVHGDSLNYTVAIPESALTRVGAASLTACDNIYASIKATDADSDDSDADVNLTVAILSDVSETRTVKLTATAAALASGSVTVPDGETSVAYKLDVVLVEGSEKLTAAQLDFNLLWQADNQ